MINLMEAIERSYHKANLERDPDIYKIIFGYKAIKNLDAADIDNVYEYIAMRLGHMKGTAELYNQISNRLFLELANDR